MTVRSLPVFLVAALSLATPLSTFAASAAPSISTVTKEEILENVTTDAIEPIAPSMPIDGKGGGGGVMNSLYYPGPGAGVQVQADIIKSVTPDYVAITAYCESGKMPTRQAVRDSLQQIYMDIKNMVGKDGRVRKSGAVSAYPFYDMSGTDTSSFNGTLSLSVRLLNRDKAEAISDFIEQKNCTVNWDVRLLNTQTHELKILDELAAQLNARKTVFEKLLQKRLTKISGATLSTWVDGYGTYDPDTNTVDATTSLTVTFDLGGRVSLPTPTPMEKAVPRG